MYNPNSPSAKAERLRAAAQHSRQVADVEGCPDIARAIHLENAQIFDAEATRLEKKAARLGKAA